MNSIFTPVLVDGMEFEIMWFDFGTYFKMNVLLNRRLFGSKKFPISTERSEGAIVYSIRKIMKERMHNAEAVHL